MLNMQNVKDIEITEGNVRTILDKDNRLIWGRLAYDTKYAGDTYQQTYSGKNLFNKSMTPTVSGGRANTVTETDTGIRITVNTGGGYSFRGWVVGKVSDHLNQTLTLSATVSKSASGAAPRIHLAYCDSSGENRKIISYANGIGEKSCSGQITTSDADGREYILVVLYGSEGTGASAGDYSQYDNAQLELGSQPTSYEPYTGGIPAPNPDYPQDIQVVTGEQTVAISDGVISHNYPISLNIGNMAPISGFQLGGMNRGVPSLGNKYQINNGNNPIKVNPNTQYTISVNLGETVKGVRVGIHSCDADLNFLNDSGWKQIAPTPYTFTTGANVEYVKLIFSLSTTSSTVNTTTQDTTIYDTVGEWLRGCSLKMNEGSSAILDIELCKIGNYQDYIYKSSDDWYVHKAIEKILNYNGETITTDYISTTGGLTNGATVYYGLATPTDTKITDTTLISQLDAVHEWLTRYGYSATVTGNLPIIINQTNL